MNQRIRLCANEPRRSIPVNRSTFSRCLLPHGPRNLVPATVRISLRDPSWRSWPRWNQLIQTARMQGIKQLYSVNLSNDAAMSALAADLGMSSMMIPR